MPAVTLASCAAEFVGTFVLVFTVGCNVLAGNPVWGGMSIACGLMVVIYALNRASGAHFNPAVSFACGLAGKVDEGLWQVGIYIFIQVHAAVLAGFGYRGLYGDSFNLGPTEGFTWWQAMLCELFYTFMLCFVVLNCAASKKLGEKNEFYGLAIAFVIAAGAYGPGALSGGLFNPAAAIAIDAASIGKGFGWCLIYSFFEMLGAALAVMAFWMLRPEERLQTEVPKEYSLRSKLVGEGIGTYMLVLTAGLNVLTESKAAAFSIASCLMCMIYAVGDVSGGHFNPAVTVAVTASGRGQMEKETAAVYMVTQVGAGLCGAFTYALLMGGVTFSMGPGPGFGWFSVTMAEVIYTFLLAFVVLCVCTVQINPAPELSGFIVGMCVTAGGLAIGEVSGGALNPAVALGVAAARIVFGGTFYKGIVYMALEVMGGLAAAALFRVVYPEEFKEPKEAKQLRFSAETAAA